MDPRVRSLLLVLGVVAAAAVALFERNTTPAPSPVSEAAPAAPAALERTDTPMDDPMDPQLPSNPPGDELEAISWLVPSPWRSVPNASDMLIATYHVPRSGAADEGELTVVRANGSAADAIQHWVGQFEKTGPEKRTVRTVHGLEITIVEVVGTLASVGGMSASPAAVRRPGWALLGAIVKTEGSPYFFKLLGPAATVGAARADFQALIDSVTPSPR
jgi:hypothetical protein